MAKKWHEEIEWEKHMPDGSVILNAEQYFLLSSFHLAAVALAGGVFADRNASRDLRAKADALSHLNIDLLSSGVFTSQEEIDRLIAESTGPDGEVYGHRD
ncbi:MAG: hypothetical protein AAAB13_20465 [Pseudomonas sp.]